MLIYINWGSGLITIAPGMSNNTQLLCGNILTAISLCLSFLSLSSPGGDTMCVYLAILGSV